MDWPGEAPRHAGMEKGTGDRARARRRFSLFRGTSGVAPCHPGMKTFFSLLFVASTLTAMACSSSDGDTSPDASPDASADATPTPDAALPTCVAKGGSCTPVVPGACANGTVDSAVSDCGAGQVGAACCIPNAKPSCASLGGTCAPVAPGACAGTVEPRGDCGGGVGVACCVPPKPTPKPSCASRGGTCVPVVPNACPGGTIDANADCGSGVGVACCVAADAG